MLSIELTSYMEFTCLRIDGNDCLVTDVWRILQEENIKLKVTFLVIKLQITFLVKSPSPHNYRCKIIPRRVSFSASVQINSGFYFLTTSLADDVLVKKTLWKVILHFCEWENSDFSKKVNFKLYVTTNH